MKKLLAVLLMILPTPVFADAQQDAAAAEARRDYAAAVNIARPYAKQGAAWAQRYVGSNYAYDLGVVHDYVESRKWQDVAAADARGDYTTAVNIARPYAKQGAAWAQRYLGSNYAYGLGVVQDYAESRKWHRLAAMQGEVNSQTILGYAYHHEHGVAQNLAEAVKWYRLAAAQGQPSAQAQLGSLYEEGLGVVQNEAEALRWYRLAAAQGQPMAQKKVPILVIKEEDDSTCRGFGFAYGSDGYGTCRMQLWEARQAGERQQAKYEQRTREYEAQVAAAQAEARREDYLRKAQCGFASASAANQRGATNGQAYLNLLACEAGASGPVSVPPPPPPRPSGPLIINTPTGTTTCVFTGNVINCNR